MKLAGKYLDHAILITFVVFVFCCGIGIGLFLGLDSQEAKVKKLEEDNRVLAEILAEEEIVITIIDIGLDDLVGIMRHFDEEQNKSWDYNEDIN